MEIDNLNNLMFVLQTNSEGAEHCSIPDESADTDSGGGRRLSGSDNKDAEASAEDGKLFFAI